MEKSKVQRGEIYLYNFGENEGSIQNGVRPVLVVQCNAGNQASPTTVVAAITSAVKKRYLPTHVFLNDNFGLREPSMVLLEQLKTVNQDDLTHFIGQVNSSYVLKQIDIGLKKSMGLWVNRPLENKRNERCLCSRCVNDYKSNPNYIVRRVDPFEKEKDTCEKCGALGWNYLIFDREKR